MKVKRLTPAEAVEQLHGCEALDPRGLTDAADLVDLAAGAECYQVDAPGGTCTFAVVRKNGTLWVDAAIGRADVDLTDVLAQLLPEIAGDAKRIAFQTRRGGLASKAVGHKYRIAGWIMEKDLA